MKKSVTKRLPTILGLVILVVTSGIFYYTSVIDLSGYSSIKERVAERLPGEEEREAEKRQESQTELSRTEMNRARDEYFFRLMRDPATNRIPANIRNRELQFAKTLPTAQQVKRRAKSINPIIEAIDYNWVAAGPFDVGGRTRALAVDQRAPNIILAGGVSGGMWKSIDGGSSWQITNPDFANLSVTDIVQDPQNPDTWYYASGEVIGNSANAIGAAYYGAGIYKSTNNGDTWNLLPQASSNTKGLVDVFNTVSDITVSPTTGSVFIASVGFGIYRSTDGQSFSSNPVLGTKGEQLFCDVAVASDGTLAAIISEASFDDQQSEDPSHPNHNPGIFISSNDGQSWTEVTPSTFPDTYRRSVISFAPSNPDILYILALKGINDTSNQGISFHEIDLGTGTSEDRSANLPDFRDNSGDGSGNMNMQSGYNMVLAVKPDDPNFVIVGGTNLFRSTDGFATTPSGGYDGTDGSQKNQFWIGGYSKDNGFSSYPNHHPDQHSIAFDPNNPNQMWSGHDGGLSYTSDVTASSVAWNNQNNGYVTSQFYSAALPQDAADTRIMGGTQDNGTPYFKLGQQTSQSTDISSGDGGYTYFTGNHLYVSQQMGRVIRWANDFTQLSYVYPSGASNQIFIHPYTIDPNDENVMYYPEGDHLWRNTELDQIPNGNSSSGTSTGWEELPDLNLGTQYLITALAVSKVPGNILYYGGYSSSQQPILKRLTNAKTATSGATDISLPNNSELAGAYVKDLAINPINANEVIVVLSNYNITGLYHTTDGGQNWEAIEGNLTGNSSSPGPSLRSAAIIPAESGTIYLLGTTTGLYSTQLLDGSNTTWGQEASNEIGNAVTEELASRVSDGDIAAGTHGRGMFLGDFQGSTNAPFIVANPLKGRAGDSVILQANDFQFSSTASDNIVTFGNRRATVLSATPSQLKVEIPRGVLGRQASSNSVTITVKTNGQSIFTTFEILPPNNFKLDQNYPNPFNPSTNIPFDITVDSRVSIVIYNMSGQKVLEPIRETDFNAGTYNQNIDLTGLASGVYIYRVITEPQSEGTKHIESKKMTFIK